MGSASASIQDTIRPAQTRIQIEKWMLQVEKERNNEPSIEQQLQSTYKNQES